MSKQRCSYIGSLLKETYYMVSCKFVEELKVVSNSIQTFSVTFRPQLKLSDLYCLR